MAEVTLQRLQLWQVVEQGIIPRGEVVHGLYTTEAEAVARFYEVLKQQPGLAITGSLQVRTRTVEAVENLRREVSSKLELSPSEATP